MSQSNLQPSASTNLVELGDMKFDNRFVRGLPGDPETHNGSRQVSNACYTRVDPTPVKAPRLLAWADPVGEMLGIARPNSATGPGGSGTRRQLHPARHAALRRALRRASVRPLGGPARRWARDYAGRSARPGRHSPRVAAQGRGQDTIFAYCRRPGGFALFGAGNFSAAKPCIIWACRRRAH